MAGLLKARCNIFGAETGGARLLGGLGTEKVSRQWFCPSESVGRFVMECEHGHKGQIMPLCQKHYMEFRNSVSYCPPCNTDEATGHKCRLALHHVS